MFYESKVVTAGGAVFGDLDVAVLMPGVRVAEDTMQPGDSFTNTLANEVTDYELKWIGPEAVPGYPDAHRFEFSLEIPDPIGPFTMTGVAHVAPGVGPVRIVVDQTADFGTRKYTVILTDGPS